ncbi:MAG: hypothetical protein CMJ48_00050 [Planctomycetaceae bacterium]|nr:hypothetical protein [Planctomycetaceae bacterium]
MKLWVGGLCGLVALVAGGCLSGPDLGELFSGEAEDEVVAKSGWSRVAAHGVLRTPVVSVAFSPDGKAIATGHYPTVATDVRVSVLFSPPGHIQLWQLDPDDHLRTLSDKGSVTIEGYMFERLQFTSDSRHVCVHVGDSVDDRGQDYRYEVLVWDADTFKLERRNASSRGTLSGGARFVTEREGDPHDESTIVIRDLATGSVLSRLKANRPQDGLVFSPDARLLATSVGETSENRTTAIWDCASGNRLCTLPFDADWSASGFSRDGKSFAAGHSINKSIEVWNSLDGSTIRTLVPGFSKEYTSIRGLAFSPDDRLLAAALEVGRRGEIRVWEIEGGKLLTTIADPSIWGFTAVAFSPDGTLLAAGDPEGVLTLCAVPEEHRPGNVGRE